MKFLKCNNEQEKTQNRYLFHVRKDKIKCVSRFALDF